MLLHSSIKGHDITPDTVANLAEFSVLVSKTLKSVGELVTKTNYPFILTLCVYCANK